MLGSYVRDFFILAFSLALSVVVLAVGINGMKVVRGYGKAMTQARVNQENLSKTLEYNGIDNRVCSRDESVAFALNYSYQTDFEISVRYAEDESRESVLADGRIFTKDVFLKDPTKYTVDFLNSKFKAGKLYKTYLVYNGADTTQINETVETRIKGDTVTGIAFIEASE